MTVPRLKRVYVRPHEEHPVVVADADWNILARGNSVKVSGHVWIEETGRSPSVAMMTFAGITCDGTWIP